MGATALEYTLPSPANGRNHTGDSYAVNSVLGEQIAANLQATHKMAKPPIIKLDDLYHLGPDGIVTVTFHEVNRPAETAHGVATIFRRSFAIATRFESTHAGPKQPDATITPGIEINISRVNGHTAQTALDRLVI